jgi:hypothetical protein
MHCDKYMHEIIGVFSFPFFSLSFSLFSSLFLGREVELQCDMLNIHV